MSTNRDPRIHPAVGDRFRKTTAEGNRRYRKVIAVASSKPRQVHFDTWMTHNETNRQRRRCGIKTWRKWAAAADIIGDN